MTPENGISLTVKPFKYTPISRDTETGTTAEATTAVDCGSWHRNILRNGLSLLRWAKPNEKVGLYVGDYGDWYEYVCDDISRVSH